MDRKRSDLLAECNASGAPLDLFTQECCMRCGNAECSRSRFGQSTFDKRVNTWMQRLFTEIPKMDPRDPRFSLISGQKFLTLDTGPTPEVRTSSWIDPRDLKEPTPPKPAIVPPPSPPSIPESVPGVVVEPPAIVSATKLQPVKKFALPREMVLANAPSQSGKTLSHSTPTSEPQKGGWASGPVSVPQDQNVKVVEPGATVKLGS